MNFLTNFDDNLEHIYRQTIDMLGAEHFEIQNDAYGIDFNSSKRIGPFKRMKALYSDGFYSWDEFRDIFKGFQKTYLISSGTYIDSYDSYRYNNLTKQEMFQALTNALEKSESQENRNVAKSLIEQYFTNPKYPLSSRAVYFITNSSRGFVIKRVKDL